MSEEEKEEKEEKEIKTGYIDIYEEDLNDPKKRKEIEELLGTAKDVESGDYESFVIQLAKKQIADRIEQKMTAAIRRDDPWPYCVCCKTPMQIVEEIGGFRAICLSCGIGQINYYPTKRTVKRTWERMNEKFYIE